MILLPRAVKVYFATQPTNLRQSFEGLTNQIRHALAYDPLSGHVFVFLNRRRNQVKLILWTRGGFTIVHKRLDRNTFRLPTAPDDAKVISIDERAFDALLDGIEIDPSTRTRRRRIVH